MFMIVSQKSKNLIAIGNKLLKVWGMADVFDAAQAYESGRIRFNRAKQTVQLGEGRRLKCQVSNISSVIGDLSLCIVKIPDYEGDECFSEDTHKDPLESEPLAKEETTKEPEFDSKLSLVSDNIDDIDIDLEQDKSKIQEEKKSQDDLVKDEFSLDDFIEDEEHTIADQKRETEKEETKSEAKQEAPKSQKSIGNNSEGIDLDELLMSEEVGNELILDKKPKPLKDEKPKSPKSDTKDGEQGDKLELDDIFGEIISNDDDTKKDDKKLEDDLDLDSFGLVDEQNLQKPDKTESKAQDKVSKDDDFDLDIFDEPKKEDSSSADIDDGDLDLDSLFDDERDDTKEVSPAKEPTKDIDDSDLDLDSFFDDMDIGDTPKQTKETKAIDDDLNFDDFDIDGLFDEPKEEPKKETPKRKKAPAPEPMPVDLEDSGLLSIKDNTSIEQEIKEKPKHTQSLRWRELIDGFDIDLSKNAQKMEFSETEYEDLIESFIRDSKDMENLFRFGDKKEQSSAISTLSDAISLLHLTPLDELLQEIVNSNESNRNSIIDAFYKILDEIAEKIQEARDKREFGSNQPAKLMEAKEAKETVEPRIEEKEPEVSNNLAPANVVSVDEFLKDVKIVPIEFSIKIAADELNLPEDLVLEFVNDFSNQGHEYIPELINAYQSGDLDKLQKTAHMLKGAASNLRIEPMVQNLYDLQFDNDLSRAPERIKLFAGQLMSLDQYLKQLAN